MHSLICSHTANDRYNAISLLLCSDEPADLALAQDLVRSTPPPRLCPSILAHLPPDTVLFVISQLHVASTLPLVDKAPVLLPLAGHPKLATDDLNGTDTVITTERLVCTHLTMAFYIN
jgi:hypothetical protein